MDGKEYVEQKYEEEIKEEKQGFLFDFENVTNTSKSIGNRNSGTTSLLSSNSFLSSTPSSTLLSSSVPSRVRSFSNDWTEWSLSLSL